MNKTIETIVYKGVEVVTFFRRDAGGWRYQIEDSTSAEDARYFTSERSFECRGDALAAAKAEIDCNGQ